MSDAMEVASDKKNAVANSLMSLLPGQKIYASCKRYRGILQVSDTRMQNLLVDLRAYLQHEHLPPIAAVCEQQGVDHAVKDHLALVEKALQFVSLLDANARNLSKRNTDLLHASNEFLLRAKEVRDVFMQLGWQLMDTSKVDSHLWTSSVVVNVFAPWAKKVSVLASKVHRLFGAEQEVGEDASQECVQTFLAKMPMVVAAIQAHHAGNMHLTQASLLQHTFGNFSIEHGWVAANAQAEISADAEALATFRATMSKQWQDKWYPHDIRKEVTRIMFEDPSINKVFTAFKDSLPIEYSSSELPAEFKPLTMDRVELNVAIEKTGDQQLKRQVNFLSTVHEQGLIRAQLKGFREKDASVPPLNKANA